MTPGIIPIAFLVTVHIVLCGYVTSKLCASAFYEPQQKRIQLFILWFLPILGIVFVWIFLRPERPTEGASLDADEDEIPESVFSDKSSPNTSVGEVSGSD
jgi:hypothetical protein